MADFILAFGLLGGVWFILLYGWKRLAGAARSRWRLLARLGLTFLVAATALGFGLYRLTKSRDFQLAGELVQRVETDERVVALTFDDGPTPGYTEWVLGELAAHEASATFYLVGGACEENPALLRSIIGAGHEVGNHTYSHPRLYFRSESTVAEEIERTDAIFRAAGYRGPITFRMPGCKRLLTTPLYLSRTERTAVTWDLEPDSLPGVAGDARAIADNVVANVRPGSIVLMHVMYDSSGPTREALPVILDRLRAQGYRFVTVSELLALRKG